MYLKTATALEKIHFVVQMIAHKLELAPHGSAVTITEFEISNHYVYNPLSGQDFSVIVEKLVKDEQVIKVVKYPTSASYNKYTGRLLSYGVSDYQLAPTDKFKAYRQKIQAQFDEEQKSGAINLFKSFSSAPIGAKSSLGTNVSMPAAPIVQGSPAAKQEALVSIRFDALNRYILLNDFFLIAQPSYDSENFRFFEYVWKNPNRTISLDELNEKLEEPINKPLAKILDNLNFRGALKDAFFQVSKTSVCFIPSRSIRELTEANLYPLRLFSTQRSD